MTLVDLAPSDRAGQLAFDVVAETLARTTLGELRAGDRVNLEPAATPTTLLDGHLVQGHIEGVGRVVQVQSQASDDYRVTIEPPPDLMPCLAPKGSVAIDGVSLTIAGVTDHTFEVALIPTTLAQTTLGVLQVGDHVNLESDIIARTVVHVLERTRAGLR